MLGIRLGQDRLHVVWIPRHYRAALHRIRDAAIEELEHPASWNGPGWSSELERSLGYRKVFSTCVFQLQVFVLIYFCFTKELYDRVAMIYSCGFFSQILRP